MSKDESLYTKQVKNSKSDQERIIAGSIVTGVGVAVIAYKVFKKYHRHRLGRINRLEIEIDDEWYFIYDYEQSEWNLVWRSNGEPVLDAQENPITMSNTAMTEKQIEFPDQIEFRRELFEDILNQLPFEYSSERRIGLNNFDLENRHELRIIEEEISVSEPSSDVEAEEPYQSKKLELKACR